VVLVGASAWQGWAAEKGDKGAKASKDPPTAKLIDFSVRLAPGDPFSDANHVGATLKEVRRGEVLHLTITGAPKPGYHTYPLTRRTPGQSEAQLSTLTFEKSDVFRPIWPVSESEAKFVKEEASGVLLEHERPFTWSLDVLVLPTAKPGEATLRFTARVQLCNDRSCIWGDHPFAVPLTVLSEPPEPPEPGLEARLKGTQPPPEVVPVPGQGLEASPEVNKSSGLRATIMKALLGGLISLLTPCVFPMIPITISFFLKQAEARGASPLPMAAAYSLTIVVVLTAGGIALISVLVDISQHYLTNFVLAGVFLVFSLSLLGMYDITLPSWLTEMTSSREGQGGLLGVVFMALTFSIISFACVGPIYGGFITLEATTQSTAANLLQRFVGPFAFALAFAAPFFVLALFPTLMRALPRSGSWMNSVKVVMGFLELAAVFKFLRAAELNYFAKSEWFTFDLTLGIYVALCIACGLYLLNVYRLPHDHEAPESIGVPRLLFSLTFLALGLYLVPGMFKNEDGEPQRPRGEVYLWVRSFLLPEPSTPAPPGATQARAGRSARLVWLTDYTVARQQSAAQKKPLFIDFTGLG
jgi:thiol:disulfide interchange protein DsbD